MSIWRVYRIDVWSNNMYILNISKYIYLSKKCNYWFLLLFYDPEFVRNGFDRSLSSNQPADSPLNHSQRHKPKRPHWLAHQTLPSTSTRRPKPPLSKCRKPLIRSNVAGSNARNLQNSRIHPMQFMSSPEKKTNGEGRAWLTVNDPL